MSWSLDEHPPQGKVIEHSGQRRGAQYVLYKHEPFHSHFIDAAGKLSLSAKPLNQDWNHLTNP